MNGIRLVGKRSGVGRAIEAILRSLDHVEHPFDEILVYTPCPLEAAVALPRGGRNVVLSSPAPPSLWEQFVLPRAHDSAHLLFCPSYVTPLVARGPILLVHHGSYEGYGAAFPWWPRTKARIAYQASAARANLVVTVSEHSKRAIQRHYGLCEKKIRVIPEGVDTSRFRPLSDPVSVGKWRAKRLGHDQPCLLYVGKPNPRRNIPNLLHAFAHLRKYRSLPHKLVLVGTDLPGSPVGPLITELGLESAVVQIGFADHDEMPIIYNAADIVLYPSAYEGFGMPVLEAMACGRPVVALDNTAFPEFAGGVARLLPDAAVPTLVQAIDDLLQDSDERERMRRDGPCRAAAYDWHILTERYVAVMRELVG